MAVVGEVTASGRPIEAEKSPGGLADAAESQVEGSWVLLTGYQLSALNDVSLLVKLNKHQMAVLRCQVGVEGFALLDFDAGLHQKARQCLLMAKVVIQGEGVVNLILRAIHVLAHQHVQSVSSARVELPRHVYSTRELRST